MELLKEFLVSKIGFDVLRDLLIPLTVATLIALILSLYHYHVLRKVASSVLNPFQTFPALIIITTTLFCVLQFSVGLSLGLIGSLSLVRFRIAIKSFTDIVTILIAITVSIICAIKFYLGLLIFLAFIFIFFGALYFLKNDQLNELNGITLFLSMKDLDVGVEDFINEVEEIFSKDRLKDVQLKGKNINLTLEILSDQTEKVYLLLKKHPGLEFQLYKRENYL